jgi:hypothetical protein
MLHALSSEMSDHCPVLLTCNANFKPMRRFKFEDSWTGRKDFLDVVKAACQSCPHNAIANLNAKLACTTKALKSWSAQFTNHLALRAAISSELIFRHDRAMNKRPLTKEESRFRAMLKVNYLGIAAVQISMWHQRSRIQCLREADASTRFFTFKCICSSS